MDFFFKPKGIALIGATPNTQKSGHVLLHNLRTGFKGPIYPVNPRYGQIDGLTCYRSVLDIPDPVDLAVVFIAAPLVPQAVKDCAARGIPGVMIESAGFAETGEAGRALQEQLKEVGRQTGIRLWGPNCMGLVDAARGYIFSFVSPSIWEEGLAGGGVSLIVQSGMLSGVFLIDALSHGTLGVAKVCSIGNKVDVNECELLEYLLDDGETGAVGLYLESVTDGRRFLEICKGAGKPVVVLKGGKSARGAQAALSHTGSLAGNGAVFSAALAQAGVLEATGFKQMMDLCQTLSMIPKPPPAVPGRIAVLTYSGGAGIVSSDYLEQMGLPLAGPTRATIDAVQSIYPPWMPAANPFDLWPAIESHGTARVYEVTARAVFSDPQVDGVLFHDFVGGFAISPGIEPLAKEARAAGKPLLCWLLGRREEARTYQIGARELGVPVFRELQRAVECLAAVFKARKR
jgi:acetyltransferase